MILAVIIGEDNYRGKGFGKKSMLWLLSYGFKKLKLHKIKLQVDEENTNAHWLYKKLGFKTEGVMKEEYYYKEKFYDLIIMAKFER